MNLRHYFYHSYFDGLELEQPVDKEHRKLIGARNELKFREHNKNLIRTWTQLPQAAALPATVTEAALAVLNPGLLTGSGYTHEIGYPAEFMLGFSFDFTTGMPLLPGHSVKGVLRSVFPQLKFNADTAWKWEKEPDALQRQKAQFVLKTLSAQVSGLPDKEDVPAVLRFVHLFELALFEGFDAVQLSAEAPVAALLPLSKRAVFFDALAVKTNADGRLMGRDALTPHPDPLKKPIPLPFIKVVEGVVFRFQWRMPEIKIDGISLNNKVLGDFCTQVLKTVGVGAKTNTGYGQLNEPMPRPVASTADGQGKKEAEGQGQEEKIYLPKPPEFPDPPSDRFTNLNVITTGTVISAQILNPKPDKPDKTRLRLLTKPEVDNKTHRFQTPPLPGSIIQVKCTLDQNGKISAIEPI